MRKLILFLLGSVLAFAGHAQVFKPNTVPYKFKGIKADSLMIIPAGVDTPRTSNPKWGTATDGALFLRNGDSSLWGKIGSRWRRIAGVGGGGTVTSVTTGLGLTGGPITTSGAIIVDTASSSIVSRQRAAATYFNSVRYINDSTAVFDRAGLSDTLVIVGSLFSGGGEAAASPPCTITGFTPTNGQVGDAVIITGTNFTGATSVTFNNTNVTDFVLNSASQITAAVPVGAASGTIGVTTPVNTATSSLTFTVTIPDAPVTGFQLATPVLRSGTVATASYAYASWDTVPNAEFYIVHKSLSSTFTALSEKVFEGGGADFFDPIPAGTQIFYKVVAFNKIDSIYADSNPLYFSVTSPSYTTVTSGVSANMVRCAVKMDAENRIIRVDNIPFTIADTGKIITIFNRRYTPWYSEGKYAFNGIITSIDNGKAVLSDVFVYGLLKITTSQRLQVYGNKRLGDPVSELFNPGVNVSDSCYYGSNDYDAIRVDLENAGASNQTKIVYPISESIVDPYRSRYFMTVQHLKEGKTGWKVDKDITMSRLNVKFAFEDFHFHLDDPDSIPTYTLRAPFRPFTHYAKTLRLDSCTFTGPNNRAMFAGNTGATTFYAQEDNATTTNLFFTNSTLKGGGADHTSGFLSGFEIRRTSTIGKKTTGHFQNSILATSSALTSGLRNFDYGLYAGVRITVKNILSVGSGNPQHQLPVIATIANNVLTVDSIAYPYFSFYYSSDPDNINYHPIKSLYGYQQNGYVRNGGTGIARNITVTSKYSGVTTYANGTYPFLSNFINGSGSNDIDGHFSYINTNAEIYFDSIELRYQYKQFIRRNSPDLPVGVSTYPVVHNQTSIIAINYIPKDPATSPFSYLEPWMPTDYASSPLEASVQMRVDGINLNKPALVKRINRLSHFNDNSAMPGYYEDLPYFNGPIGVNNSTSKLKNVGKTYELWVTNTSNPRSYLNLRGKIMIDNSKSTNKSILIIPNGPLDVSVYGGVVSYNIGLIKDSSVFCCTNAQGVAVYQNAKIANRDDSISMKFYNVIFPGSGIYISGYITPGINRNPFTDWAGFGKYKFQAFNSIYDPTYKVFAYTQLYYNDAIDASNLTNVYNTKITGIPPF